MDKDAIIVISNLVEVIDGLLDGYDATQAGQPVRLSVDWKKLQEVMAQADTFLGRLIEADE